MSSRGGSRSGSGRPATGHNTSVVSFRLPNDLADAFRNFSESKKRSIVSLLKSSIRGKTR